MSNQEVARIERNVYFWPPYEFAVPWRKKLRYVFGAKYPTAYFYCNNKEAFMLKEVVIVGLGSCMGGMLRFLVSKFCANVTTSSFPYGTLVVNLVGCLAIGLLSGLAERGGIASTSVRLFMTVGVCGGFTTFSTFMNESSIIAHTGGLSELALYLAASIGGGFLLVIGGYALARAF